MKNLLTRTLSGLIYCSIIIAAIWFGIDTVNILAALFGILGIIELTKICGNLTSKHIPVILLDIAGVLALSMSPYIFPILIWIGVLIFRLIFELYLKDGDTIKNISESFFGQLYIGMPLGCMVMIATWFGSPMILMAIFFLIWINDTGAFVTGCTFGKHRLFERISPKKSWEGFFGGLTFSLMAAYLFGTYCQDFFAWHHNIYVWLGLAIVTTTFATWGDLVESLIKRTLHIKDSGNLIPGHGGILDRIDSLLLVAPAAMIYMTLVEL